MNKSPAKETPMPGSSALGAKKIISYAKRFQDYELGGHGVEKHRTPYGSAYNNMSRVEIEQRV